VLLGRSKTPRCWRASLPRAASSRFLSSLRGLVAAAHPSPWGLWPSMLWKEVYMPVYWSHAARHSQILSRVSSQSLASASCMSSVHDRHNQVCLALVRANRRIAHVVSSCLVHLAMWAWRVWPRIGMGVGCWRRPSSVGPMKGREAVELGRSHTVLYAWVHF